MIVAARQMGDHFVGPCMTKEGPPRHKEHQEDIEGITTGSESPTSPAMRLAIPVCFGELGAVVAWCCASLAGQIRRERFAGQRGFSIAELIVGIQVSVILTLTALPIMSPILRGYRLRGAAHEILADLETARMGAVMENHHYRFVVVDTHTFQLHDDTNSNDVVDAGETVMTRDIRLDNPGVMIATGSSNITFAPNGTAPTNGTITVSSENVATETAQVLVSWGGRAHIQ